MRPPPCNAWMRDGHAFACHSTFAARVASPAAWISFTIMSDVFLHVWRLLRRLLWPQLCQWGSRRLRKLRMKQVMDTVENGICEGKNMLDKKKDHMPRRAVSRSKRRKHKRSKTRKRSGRYRSSSATMQQCSVAYRSNQTSETPVFGQYIDDATMTGGELKIVSKTASPTGDALKSIEALFKNKPSHYGKQFYGIPSPNAKKWLCSTGWLVNCSS